jgi:hypothetical protein
MRHLGLQHPVLLALHPRIPRMRLGLFLPEVGVPRALLSRVVIPALVPAPGKGKRRASRSCNCRPATSISLFTTRQPLPKTNAISKSLFASMPTVVVGHSPQVRPECPRGKLSNPLNYPLHSARSHALSPLEAFLIRADDFMQGRLS